MYLKLCGLFFPGYISWSGKNLYGSSQAFPVRLRHFIQMILEDKTATDLKQQEKRQEC